MQKYRLLILKNEISIYNVPVFNKIAERYDLTVGYYLKDKSEQECHFRKKCFAFYRIGPLIFVKGLRAFTKSFDLVCFVPDMHVFSYCVIPFLSHTFKVVSWSIGFRVSYEHPYITTRRHTFADRVFQSIISHCDASIFYMEKAKDFWCRTKLNMNNIFVAPNTTQVIPIDIIGDNKRIFLFVGTLYKGKGLDLLLESYKHAVDKAHISNELHIIGDGCERHNIETYIQENGLEGKVFLHGAIYNELVLASFFKNALLCISPTQGGLSVPKSMGYGVPFVTKGNSITGGEIYHIDPGENGILYQQDRELESILIDAGTNPTKYVEMGIKAKDYYDKYATIDCMAEGAMTAFDSVLK